MRNLVIAVALCGLLVLPSVVAAQEDVGNADWLAQIQPPLKGHGVVIPDGCRRVTDGFDLPLTNPCRPDLLGPTAPGFVKANLVVLPTSNDGSVYVKPPFPSGVPLVCPGVPSDCLQSVANQVPSPIGETMFRSMSIGVGGGQLDLDGVAIYAYDCPDGGCQGYAWQVWEAMPSAQKEAYLSAMIQAVEQWHPDLVETLTVRRPGPGGAPLTETLAKWDGAQMLFFAGQPKPGPSGVAWMQHLP